MLSCCTALGVESCCTPLGVESYIGTALGVESYIVYYCCTECWILYYCCTGCWDPILLHYSYVWTVLNVELQHLPMGRRTGGVVRLAGVVKQGLVAGKREKAGADSSGGWWGFFRERQAGLACSSPLDSGPVLPYIPKAKVTAMVMGFCKECNQ